MLEKELRFLHLDPKAAGDWIPDWAEFEYLKTSKPTPTMIHLLQQGQTYSNKATPPNRATPRGPSIQTHESMEGKHIQTTTV